MSSIRPQVVSSYSRTASAAPQAPPRAPPPNVQDDYERWYTEYTASNRMLLSLRSGIEAEVGWALDRLWRLATNDQFVLTAIPALIDALFDLPEWYAREGFKDQDESALLFSESSEVSNKRRFAAESLLILHNSAFINEYNTPELTAHPRTLPFLLDSIHNIDPYASDFNGEFYLLSIELLQAVAPSVSLPQISRNYPNPITPIENWLEASNDRTEIMAGLDVLFLIFSAPKNVPFLQADSPALSAALRYITLAFIDAALVDSCLNFLYAYLSHPPLAKAFLFHPAMPSVLKIMVNVLLTQQIEETLAAEIGPPVRTISAIPSSTKDHILSMDEFNHVLTLSEPQRCFEWMKLMFEPNPNGELTQVQFWTLYRDVFGDHANLYPTLQAPEVIKNVTQVFPSTLPMVLPGPPQRFIVRGVSRKQDHQETDHYRCLWNRSTCVASSFNGPEDLAQHLYQHIHESHGSNFECLWSECSHVLASQAHLKSHVLTHLRPTQDTPLHPSQDDAISLGYGQPPFQMKQPTTRQPPALRGATMKFTRPTADPPTTSLTALLCIRILFRISFVATANDAPKIDADHFGFPGLVADATDERAVASEDTEQEGERRGRQAFVGVRRLLSEVRIKDEVLMGWILEMQDASQSWEETS